MPALCFEDGEVAVGSMATRRMDRPRFPCGSVDFPEGAWGAAPANELSTAAYLVLRNECLLRLFANPLRDVVLSVLEKMAPGGFGYRWRSSAADPGDLGIQRVLGLFYNFCSI
jgi:hypothetical protein